MTLRPHTAALLLAALAACGSSSETPRVAMREAAGGTRLKVRWWASPDGLVRPRTPTVRSALFHDTVRGLDCNFEVAGDGAWRCLPPLTAPLVTGQGETYHSDDACTQPLVYVPSSCAGVPAHASSQELTCPSSLRRFVIGASLTAGAAIYRRDTSGSCTLFSHASSGAYHVVGSEIDYLAFAPATASEGETHDGLTQALLAGEDGSMMPLGLHSAASADLLEPLPAADGVQRLLPAWSTSASYDPSYTVRYADDACTAPAVSLPGSCATPPTRALEHELSADGCQDRFRVYAVGARLDAHFVEGTNFGTCVPGVAYPGVTPYARGAEVAAGTLPAAPALSPQAVGRLRRSSAGAGATWRWPGGTVTDTAFNAEVAPLTDSEGVLRWLPSAVALSVDTQRWFTDGECTVPLYLFDGAPCAPGPRLATFYSSCPYRSVVAPLAPFAGGYIFTKSSGFCIPATPPGSSSAYTAGTPIPPETFLLATEVLR